MSVLIYTRDRSYYSSSDTRVFTDLGDFVAAVLVKLLEENRAYLDLQPGDGTRYLMLVVQEVSDGEAGVMVGDLRRSLVCLMPSSTWAFDYPADAEIVPGDVGSSSGMKLNRFTASMCADLWNMLAGFKPQFYGWLDQHPRPIEKEPS